MEKNINYDATTDDEFELRNVIIQERDENDTIIVNNKPIGRITSYKYHILQRDKKPLIGVLSRLEVEQLFRLYSAEGSNLTQRTVSTYFPHLTISEFKKILKAFKLTKASAPIAPHLLEEFDTEKLIELNQQQRENDFLRKVEQDRARLTEQRHRELVKEHNSLKEQIKDFKMFLTDFKVPKIKTTKSSIHSTSGTIVVYLSDMHVGADVSDYSIYQNTYNELEIKSRFNQLLTKIQSLAVSTSSSNIVICNLGDSLDGYNAQTTRGGHALPQNMNNKEQVKVFLNTTIEFFTKLHGTNLFNSIEYYCVGEDNHSGDFGWAANLSLIHYLETSGIARKAILFDKYIDTFKIGKFDFVISHGKDHKDVFKNMPLTLNDKTENQINEYLDSQNLFKDVHFIKGDLHQSATTYGRRFRYKSVSSFFGASEWIHKNFGNTCAAVDIDVIKGDEILETRVVLN